jgi:hypothetical protein
MPTIIIQSDTRPGASPTITLRERVVPAETHSDHYLAQLIERIGWALLDAEDLEAGQPRASVRPAQAWRRRSDPLRTAA